MEHIGIVHKIIPKPNHHMLYVARPGVEKDVSKTSNSKEIDTVQPARNLHKPSDPGGQNYPRAVEHRGRTPVDPGGHDPRVSR